MSLADRDRSSILVRVNQLAAGRPIVTVVIPAHNAARTISRALNSVLAQRTVPLQIIVVDDCSTDDTASIVASGFPHVEIIRSPVQLGAAAARNLGISHARAELLAFLDADDEWLPTKLDAQVAAIQKHDGIALVSCDAVRVDADGHEHALYPDRPPAVGPDAWKTLLAYTFVATSSVLTRTALVRELGGFPPALPVAEDQDLWIRLASLGSVAYVDRVLTRVHTTANSLSFQYSLPGIDLTLAMIERHIAVLKDRLTVEEVRWIRRTRLGAFGRYAYAGGDIGRGIRFILKALMLGDNLGRNIRVLLFGLPLLQRMKTRIRRRTASQSTAAA